MMFGGGKQRAWAEVDIMGYLVGKPVPPVDV